MSLLFLFLLYTLVLASFLCQLIQGSYNEIGISKKSVGSKAEVGNAPLSPPFVMTTWEFTGATQAAWDVLSTENGSATEAVLRGCDYCEIAQCDFTVGFGGSPDEVGETTLDAMIMDGDTFNIGAVGGLRRIKNAIGVANHVMLNTEHSILVGDAASDFAKQMGFSEESLSTNRSNDQYESWKKNNCQPNFWKGVHPDSRKSCGPYVPRRSDGRRSERDGGVVPEVRSASDFHHDTIGQIAVDSTGSIAVGLSSNGALHKIPGRMGDAAVPGAGGYADSKVGAAASTGDGDVMMRFSPAFWIVEKMRNGMSPSRATAQVMRAIGESYPGFRGALIGLSRTGDFGAACHGLDRFPFSLASYTTKSVKTYYIKCQNPPIP